jgi:hypothetical protein
MGLASAIPLEVGVGLADVVEVEVRVMVAVPGEGGRSK